MALIEHTLFDGDRDLVAIAIERLRAFVPPEGYWLAFSGGKRQPGDLRPRAAGGGAVRCAL